MNVSLSASAFFEHGHCAPTIFEKRSIISNLFLENKALENKRLVYPLIQPSPLSTIELCIGTFITP